jgi:probable HAF family extracellular repeat protein
MLHLRTLFLITVSALLLAACGGSEPDFAGTGSNAAATGSTMAKAMGTTTVGSWTVTSTDLGLLAGGTMASARAINDVGQVVGTATDSTYAIQRVMWDLSKANAIVAQLPNYDPASTAEPASINDGGEVAGTERLSTSLREGVYWAATSGVYSAIGLPPLNNGSRIQITARDVNKSGVIAGSAQDGGTGLVNAVIWNRNAAPTALVTSAEALSVNDAGHVVGVYTASSLARPFLWRPGKSIDLGAVGGSSTSARAVAINNTGRIAGTSDGDTIAVVWTYNPADPSSTPSLAKLPLTSDLVLPSPTAINDSGDVVGSAWTSNYGGTRAVLWRNGQVIPLANFNSKAFGINNAGQIVGEGDANGDGRTEALLWTVTSGTTTTQPPVVGTTTNTAPSATIAVNTTSLKVGATLNVAGSFKDPDQGPWTYTIDWGDGQKATGSATPAGTVTASHAYSTPSSKKSGYKVVFTVTDAAGASASASKTVKVSR